MVLHALCTLKHCVSLVGGHVCVCDCSFTDLVLTHYVTQLLGLAMHVIEGQLGIKHLGKCSVTMAACCFSKQTIS